MADRSLWRRYADVLGHRPERDIEDELQFHLAARAAEARARGLTDAEAAREAERAFGDRRRIETELLGIGRRRQRRERRASVLTGLRSDVRQSVRTFVRRPGLPLVVVTTLALAIGATTAVFTVFQAVVLRPLPIDGSRVYVLRDAERAAAVAYPAFRDLRSQPGAWEELGAFGQASFSVRSGGFSDRIAAEAVSGSYFGTLGLVPAQGRLLQERDEVEATRGVVISHSLRQRAFPGVADVVGRTLHVNGHPLDVLGVAPAGFRGTSLSTAPELWVPLTLLPAISNGGLFANPEALTTEFFTWLSLVGRVREGVPIGRAVSELGTRFTRRQEALPKAAPSPFGPEQPIAWQAVPVQESASGRNRADLLRFVTLLWVVTGICLLIACVNVANLLLLRASDRWRDLALRMALGAERGRLARQLLAESLLLGILAGAGGLAVARAGIALLTAFSLPGDVAIAALDLRLDPRVLGFALLLSTGCALLFGMAPALWAARPALLDGLRELRHGSGPGAWLGRNVLVSVQVALSLVLLVGALLFTRSMQRALGEDLGYDVAGVAAVSFSLTQQGYTGAEGAQVLERLLVAAAERPGVTHAALAGQMPPGARGLRLPVTPAEAVERTPGTHWLQANRGLAVNPVTPAFFDLVRLRLLEGRAFTAADREGAPPVAVVSASAARALWPDGQALGRPLQLLPSVGDTIHVVGIVADGHFERVGEITPTVFVPVPQALGLAVRDQVTLAVRGTAPAEATLGMLRSIVRDAEPGLALFEDRVVARQLDRVLMAQRFGAQLLALFAVIAGVISGVGIYAVVAFDVLRRRRELGIRAALGAAGSDLVRAVFTRAGRAITVGTAAGLVLAALLTGGLRTFLYGITPHEPGSYLLAAAAFALVALCAAVLPLRRAMRADPLVVMRE